MDYSEFVIFYLKGKKYVICYFAVRDLPIFQELKKSDKVETIVYNNKISKKNINMVFDLLYCRKDYVDKIENNKTKTVEKAYRLFYKKSRKLKIRDIIEIYSFIKFITIDMFTINDFMVQYFKPKDIFYKIEYGIENNCTAEYFELIYQYSHFVLCSLPYEYFDSISTTDDIKQILFKIHEKVADIWPELKKKVELKT